MEEVTIIDGINLYNEKYKFLLEQDVEYQKLKFYSGKIHRFEYSSRKITSTHIYWSTSTKTPMFENNKLFFKHKNTSGASYDRKTKKIKIWFGQSIRDLNDNVQIEILCYFIPWFISSNDYAIRHNYINIITNGILNRMIKGSIKCNEDIIKAFCKYNPYRTFNLDTKKLNIILSETSYTNLRQFKYIFLASENPNDVVNYMYENRLNGSHYINDQIEISKLALSIGEKINIYWNNTEYTNKHVNFLEQKKDLEIIYSHLLGIEKPKEDLPF